VAAVIITSRERETKERGPDAGSRFFVLSQPATS
jgi:hypothetical protein